MRRLTSVGQHIVSYLSKKENYPYIVFFLLIFGTQFINAFHESYPDEFDNILGGWYILHGVPIYTGFFTHHGPFAYFLSSLIELVGGNSFINYRIIFAILIFGFFLWSYNYIKNRFGKDESLFYLIFIGVISLASNYYWLQMLLADTLSAYFLAPVVAILLLSTFYKSPLKMKDLVIISVLTAATALCSLTFLYLSIIIYAYAFYLYIRSNKITLRSRSFFTPILVFAAPFVLFLIYLLLSGSLGEYLYQGWAFNQRYYIYNYPRPDGISSINPIRFAIVIANNFYNSYFTLLEQVKDFNFGFPLNITFAIGTLGMIIYLLFRRKFLFSAVFLALITFANARSEPLTSKETDYQSAVYIMIAMLVISFLLVQLYKELRTNEHLGKRIVSITLFLLIGSYSIFSSLFLMQKFFNRTFDKYMGKAPLIYDYSEIAPVINKLVDYNEPVWVGPFEFKDLFYIHGRPASHYQIFIPGMGASPEIRRRMIEDFETTKPSVVYFQKNFFILGRSPEMYGQFFLDYLKEHYLTLYGYEKNGVMYKSVAPVTEGLDIETRLYIRKEKADEVIQKMLNNNLIREVVQ